MKVSFLKKIGLFFQGLWNASKKAYNELPPDQQEALLTSSKIIDLIRSGIGKTPLAVEEALIAHFPTLPVEKILDAINFVLSTFGIDAVDKIEDGVQFLQDKITAAEDKGLALVLQTFANAVAVFFAPAEMKFARIAMLMEYVYQTFVKKEKKS